MLSPVGRHFITGPGPFGLAVSPGGEYVVTANGGPNRYSVTVLDRTEKMWQERQVNAGRGRDRDDDEDDDFKSVFLGLAFDDKSNLFVSEGNSGRVRRIRLPDGRRQEIFDLNQGGARDSYTGDIAYDAKRELLYVTDQAHFRIVIFKKGERRAQASVPVGRLPFRLALSPDGKRVYVTNVGIFRYSVIPGADAKASRDTGLEFPAFGFPSEESRQGTTRYSPRGDISVPPLGDPNVAESNSVAVVAVEDPQAPKLLGFVRTGLPIGPKVHGGSSPSGLLVTRDAVYVANANQDTISVIDPATLKVKSEIALRIPGLEGLRGVLPLGMAYHEASGRLLVAEAGINAIGVVDVREGKLVGHIPTAWFPTALAFAPSAEGETLFVSSAKGHGTGPNATRSGPMARSFQADIRTGALTALAMPTNAELPVLTARVMQLNGMEPRRVLPGELPKDIRYVVIILKENRTYDEVFGDLETAANGPLTGAPELARLGRRGWVSWDRNELLSRLSKEFYNITPNHHALAQRFAFSDNFYVDSEVSVDGHHWIVGSYPNAWTETTLRAAYGGQKDFRLTPEAPGRLLFAQSNSSVHPEEQLEAGALWHHLERNGIPFRNFGEGFELAGVDEGPGLKPTGARYLTNVPMPDPLYRNTSPEYPNYNMNVPDQFRANQFITEIEKFYRAPGRELPRLLFVHLPNDHMARPRPEDGYPFQASYVADNDYALGRIVEYLSNSPWWKQMAIFVTEDDAQGGVDHVDSHRTVMMVASPYAKRNYASHVNSSFPGLLKTVFRLLGMPPLNLYDATAADLSDCFTMTPDYSPFFAMPEESEIFIPARAKDPLDPKPSERMDDPRVLREQHRQQR